MLYLQLKSEADPVAKAGISPPKIDKIFLKACSTKVLDMQKNSIISKTFKIFIPKW